MKISDVTEQMLELEKMQFERITINNELITDKSMNLENENGQVWQLNGEVGEVELKDGRKGKIIVQLDFRETQNFLTKKEYGS